MPRRGRRRLEKGGRVPENVAPPPSDGSKTLTDLDTSPPLAAVDLGSNSFHMIVAQFHGDQMLILDRLRDPVRLADGLTESNMLDEAVAQRSLECLERFGQRLRHIAPENLRAVGTNTLRRADTSTGFLERAQTALGHSIEIISGIEEARLIYLGVAHSLPDPGGRRLVVDIGGGSTELIIGEGFEPQMLESLYIGCVGMSRRFFEDGAITREAMNRALVAARLELQPIKRRFRELGWSMATGSSGTIRAVRDVVTNAGWSDNGITPAALEKLRGALIAAGHVSALSINGLSENRAPVFPGGVAVLSAVFDALKIERMLHSSGALREGVIYDLNGRIHHHDKREATVNALVERYRVDVTQAVRVEQVALSLLDAVRDAWNLKSEDARQWLHWATHLHEIGLSISHDQYHKHGAYIIRHADLAGFSLRDQKFLSLLVQAHRRKLKPSLFDALPETMRLVAVRLIVILRLAVLLRRSRSDHDMLPTEITAADNKLTLQFPAGWLEGHPLTNADLGQEKKYLKSVGTKLRFA